MADPASHDLIMSPEETGANEVHPGAFTVSGRTLLDLASDEFERSETREEGKLLMRQLIGQRLGAQTLHTR